MSDDDSPDNVRHLPRIGSPPPPPVPPPPVLTDDQEQRAAGEGTVRISAFDAPAVPHAPRPPDAVPAALRSEGLTDQPALADAGPPRTGALSLAAVLAIALAAFEGLQTWIQEFGPRRAEAAAHQRELELLAAKANADATRHHAEADREYARGRRVPSSHEYGRSALGRGSGGAGRGAGGIGAHSGSAQQRSTGSGGGSATSRNGSGTGSGSGRNGGGSKSSGGRTPGASGGSSRDGRGGTAPGGSGRRSPRQAVADWWGKGNKTPSGGSGGSGSAGKGGRPPGGSGGTDRKGAVRAAVKAARTGPTSWDAVGDRLKDRWKPRNQTTGAKGGTGGPAKPGNDGWRPPGDRTGLREAVFDAVADRWKKRREGWTADGGPRRKPGPSRKSGGTNTTSRPGPSTGPRPGPGPTGPGTAPGPGPNARSSPFDADTGPGITITVEQVDPPGAHAKRWKPTAIGPPQPALPRAPHRPAGQRPGTTRRKDPIPMAPVPARTAGTPAPVAASMPSPGGMSAQHATDITLDDALKALTLLTTAGMETHDDCAELARKARQLLGELESMAHDLDATHNVNGPRTLRAISVLMESVAQLVVQGERMARAALDAAEMAEAEEVAMARDYRPTQEATADAGLATPSARIHNEN